MKHLKLFESFKEEDIRAICEKYGIKNYTINEDGSIDVDGYVNLASKNLTKLPLKFRNITGDFRCNRNQLTSLEGSPESVGGDFYCRGNKLKTLKYSPKFISGIFACDENQLTSFEYCPESIGGDFFCDQNNITSFEHLPYSIGGDFICFDNPFRAIWILFQNYSKIEFLNDCDAIRESNEYSKEPIVILDRLNFFLEEIGNPTVTKVKGYKYI